MRGSGPGGVASESRCNTLAQTLFPGVESVVQNSSYRVATGEVVCISDSRDIGFAALNEAPTLSEL